MRLLAPVFLALALVGGCDLLGGPELEVTEPGSEDGAVAEEDSRWRGSLPADGLSEEEYRQGLAEMGYPVDGSERRSVTLNRDAGSMTATMSTGAELEGVGALRFTTHEDNFSRLDDNRYHVEDRVFVEFPGEDHFFPIILDNANLTIDPDRDEVVEGEATPQEQFAENGVFGEMGFVGEALSATFVRSREELQEGGYDPDKILGDPEEAEDAGFPDNINDDDLFLLFDLNDNLQAFTNEFGFGIEFPNVPGGVSFYYLVLGLSGGLDGGGEDNIMWPLFLFGESPNKTERSSGRSDDDQEQDGQQDGAQQEDGQQDGAQQEGGQQDGGQQGGGQQDGGQQSGGQQASGDGMQQSSGSGGFINTVEFNRAAFTTAPEANLRFPRQYVDGVQAFVDTRPANEAFERVDLPKPLEGLGVPEAIPTHFYVDATVKFDLKKIKIPASVRGAIGMDFNVRREDVPPIAGSSDFQGFAVGARGTVNFDPSVVNDVLPIFDSFELGGADVVVEMTRSPRMYFTYAYGFGDEMDIIDLELDDFIDFGDLVFVPGVQQGISKVEDLTDDLVSELMSGSLPVNSAYAISGYIGEPIMDSRLEVQSTMGFNPLGFVEQLAGIGEDIIAIVPPAEEEIEDLTPEEQEQILQMDELGRLVGTITVSPRDGLRMRGDLIGLGFGGQFGELGFSFDANAAVDLKIGPETRRFLAKADLGIGFTVPGEDEPRDITLGEAEFEALNTDTESYVRMRGQLGDDFSDIFTARAELEGEISYDSEASPSLDYMLRGEGELSVHDVDIVDTEIEISRTEGFRARGAVDIPGVRDGDGARLEVDGAYIPAGDDDDEGRFALEGAGEVTIIGHDVLDASFGVYVNADEDMRDHGFQDVDGDVSGFFIEGELSLGDVLTARIAGEIDGDGNFSFDLQLETDISIGGYSISQAEAQVTFDNNGLEVSYTHDLNFIKVDLEGYINWGGGSFSANIWGSVTIGHIEDTAVGDFGAEGTIEVRIGTDGLSVDFEGTACVFECVTVSSGFEITSDGVEFRVLGESFTIP